MLKVLLDMYVKLNILWMGAEEFPFPQIARQW